MLRHMLTVPQAARRVGRNPETIRRWIREGKLQSSKVGTQHTIDEADLNILLSKDFGLPVPKAWDGQSDESPMPNVVGVIARNRSARVAEAVAPYLPSIGSIPATVEASWLPAIVGRIVRLVDPIQITLFGSRARGTALADSDYDLLVVLDSVENRSAARVTIRRALADIPASLDIVVAAPPDLSPDREGPRGIEQWAAEQGRVVYQRN